MWHHFREVPVFIGIDNYRSSSVFIPKDESMINTRTKRDLENEIGVMLGGMVAEDEVCGADLKTVGASQDLTGATALAKKMVVEYGFGELMKNTSLIELQDYALISGKEILDDIQRILSSVQEETESVISDNKEVMMKLVDTIVDNMVMNSDAMIKFFNANEIS
jgi:ATP-dependent metalloprotease